MNLGVVPMPYVDTGVLVYGVKWIGSRIQAWYGAYGVAGLRGSNDVDWMALRSVPYNDNNAEPAVRRPARRSATRRTRGTSSATRAWAARTRPASTISTRGSGTRRGRSTRPFRFSKLALRGEYAHRTTDLDPNASGYPFQLRTLLHKEGFYAELEHPLGKYLNVVYRYEELKRTGIPAARRARGHERGRPVRALHRRRRGDAGAERLHEGVVGVLGHDATSAGSTRITRASGEHSDEDLAIGGSALVALLAVGGARRTSRTRGTTARTAIDVSGTRRRSRRSTTLRREVREVPPARALGERPVQLDRVEALHEAHDPAPELGHQRGAGGADLRVPQVLLGPAGRRGRTYAADIATSSTAPDVAPLRLLVATSSSRARAGRRGVRVRARGPLGGRDAVHSHLSARAQGGPGLARALPARARAHHARVGRRPRRCRTRSTRAIRSSPRTTCGAPSRTRAAPSRRWPSWTRSRRWCARCTPRPRASGAGSGGRTSAARVSWRPWWRTPPAKTGLAVGSRRAARRRPEESPSLVIAAPVRDFIGDLVGRGRRLAAGAGPQLSTEVEGRGRRTCRWCRSGAAAGPPGSRRGRARGGSLLGGARPARRRLERIERPRGAVLAVRTETLAGVPGWSGGDARLGAARRTARCAGSASCSRLFALVLVGGRR